MARQFKVSPHTLDDQMLLSHELQSRFPRMMAMGSFSRECVRDYTSGSSMSVNLPKWLVQHVTKHLSRPNKIISLK